VNPAPEEFVLTAGNTGLINTIPRAIVALQTTQAIKILLGAFELPAKLTTYDIWQETFSTQEILRNELPLLWEGAVRVPRRGKRITSSPCELRSKAGGRTEAFTAENAEHAESSMETYASSQRSLRPLR